jgi:hypothetical protein
MTYSRNSDEVFVDGVNTLLKHLFVDTAAETQSEFTREFARWVRKLNVSGVNQKILEKVLSSFIRRIFGNSSGKKSWQMMADFNAILASQDEDASASASASAGAKEFEGAVAIDAIFQGIVINCLRSDRSDTLDAIPSAFLLCLMNQFHDLSNSNKILFQYFETIGRSLCMASNESLLQEFLTVLNAFSERFSFENGDMTRTLNNYLQPLETILATISSILNGEYVRLGASARLTSAVITSIVKFLQLLLRSTKYISKLPLLETSMSEFLRLMDAILSNVWANKGQNLLKTSFPAIITSMEFQKMVAVEEKKYLSGNKGKPLPCIYIRLIQTMISRYLDIVGSTKTSDGSSFLLWTLDRANEVDLKNHTCLAVNYYVLMHKRVLVMLKRQLFVKPSTLEKALRILENNIEILGPNVTAAELLLRSEYKAHYTDIGRRIKELSLTKVDIKALQSNWQLVAFVREITDDESIGGGNANDQIFLQHLCDNFHQQENELRLLRDVVTFLHSRNLRPDYNEVIDMIQRGSTGMIMTLCELVNLIGEIQAQLGLDANVIYALKCLCKSKKFSDRFQINTNDKILLSAEKTVKHITDRTNQALSYLKQLIAADDIRINDFNINMDDILAEMSSQGQRQRRFQEELELIFSYFQSKNIGLGNADTNMTERIDILTSAIQLVRLREYIPNFITALVHLNMGSILADRDIDPVLVSISENFKVGDSKRLLKKVVDVLDGLTTTEILFIAKLAASDGLAASRMITFFRKSSNQELFDSVFSRAQEASLRDEHLSQIINKTPLIRRLLEPSWTYDPKNDENRWT